MVTVSELDNIRSNPIKEGKIPSVVSLSRRAWIWASLCLQIRSKLSFQQLSRQVTLHSHSTWLANIRSCQNLGTRPCPSFAKSTCSSYPSLTKQSWNSPRRPFWLCHPRRLKQFRYSIGHTFSRTGYQQWLCFRLHDSNQQPIQPSAPCFERSHSRSGDTRSQSLRRNLASTPSTPRTEGHKEAF